MPWICFVDLHHSKDLDCVQTDCSRVADESRGPLRRKTSHIESRCKAKQKKCACPFSVETRLPMIPLAQTGEERE